MLNDSGLAVFMTNQGLVNHENVTRTRIIKTAH